MSHRPSHMRLCDRVVLLEAGRIAAIGTADEILARMAQIAERAESARPGP